ncbi:hypothetical protein DBIPINDM_007366 (plasmid) [Mesorhizobium sp. AR02]|nr:hypothetical protein [Mesorhizobium sp. AR02]UVK50094.1 hypothetical protein DBIPINDM_007366 [Mesorhizobium sp. AR02]
MSRSPFCLPMPRQRRMSSEDPADAEAKMGFGVLQHPALVSLEHVMI